MELSESGKVKKHYIRGNDLVCADKGGNNASGEASEKQYYVSDPHGNVVQLTDASGKVTKTYEYDSFGNEVKPDSKDENPFRYCGEYYDKETEEIYLRARYYQPAVGRFLTRDTYTGEEDEPLSLHLYIYCGNDGVNAWDPSGHKPRTFEKYFNKKYKRIKPYRYSAIRVTLKDNQVKVNSRLEIVGAKKNVHKILKDGIEQKWSGKVKIKGYKIKVKTSVNTKYVPNVGDYDRFDYVDEPGVSNVKYDDDFDIKVGHTGTIYSKTPNDKKYSKEDLKNTVAHEFGHFLSIDDAYNSINVSPKTDIMRWNSGKDTKMSNYDVLLLLKAAAQNKLQTWDKVKKRDVK